MSISKKELAGLIVAIILSINVGCVGSSGEALINWVDYDRGISQAELENKPALINFYSAWCGACRKLDRGVFQDEQIYEKSKEFVCIKVNTGERGDLTRKYRIWGTPTTIFLDSQGKEVDRIVGAVNINNFMQYVDEILAREKALRG